MICTSNQDIRFSHSYAVQQEESLVQRLLAEQKLYLVLDLDLTILHCTDTEINLADYADPHQIDIFYLDGAKFYVKFRPGLEQWLEAIDKLYEIHIFTNATRAYAGQIVKLIEQKTNRKYFGSGTDLRIMTRSETRAELNGHQKDLQTIFPGVDKISVILDDNENVWKASVQNVVRVVPYYFFQGHGDPNDPAKIQQEMLTKKRIREDDFCHPAKKQKREEGLSAVTEALFDASLLMSLLRPKFVDRDTHLNYIFEVMRDIHGAFFAEYNQTKQIPSIQAHIRTVKHGGQCVYSEPKEVPITEVTDRSIMLPVRLDDDFELATELELNELEGEEMDNDEAFLSAILDISVY